MSKPPVTSETFANGASIHWLPHPHNAWSVIDAHGHHHGLRRRIEDACELAASLPGTPLEPEPLPRISRSPRATPLPPETFLPTGMQPDERPFADRSMSPWRARNVGRPSKR